MALQDSFERCDCPVGEQIDDYLDDCMAPQERAEFESRLNDCAKCRNEIEFFASLGDQARQYVDSVTPTEPRGRIASVSRRNESRKHHASGRIALIAIAASLLLVIGIWKNRSDRANISKARQTREEWITSRAPSPLSKSTSRNRTRGSRDPAPDSTALDVANAGTDPPNPKPIVQRIEADRYLSVNESEQDDGLTLVMLYPKETFPNSREE